MLKSKFKKLSIAFLEQEKLFNKYSDLVKKQITLLYKLNGIVRDDTGEDYINYINEIERDCKIVISRCDYITREMDKCKILFKDATDNLSILSYNTFLDTFLNVYEKEREIRKQYKDLIKKSDKFHSSIYHL